MKKVILPLIGTAAVLTIGAVLFLKNKSLFIKVKKCNFLKMEDVIAFFKNKDIIQKLKSNKDFIAVAIKEYKNNRYHIICTLYDKAKEEVLDINDYSFMFKTKDIDNDLKNAFSDKDMIVLQ